MVKIFSLGSGSVYYCGSNGSAKQSIFKIIKYLPRRRLYRWGKEWVRNEFSQLRVQVRSSRASLSSSIWKIIVSLKSYLGAAWQLEIKFPTLTMNFFWKGYVRVLSSGLGPREEFEYPHSNQNKMNIKFVLFLGKVLGRALRLLQT